MPCIVDDLPDRRKLWERMRDFEEHHAKEVEELQRDVERLTTENAKLKRALIDKATA